MSTNFNMDNILFILKSNKIDIQKYDYIEGKTKKENMEKYPIIENKRYYINPFLWKEIIKLNKNIKEIIDYIIKDEDNLGIKNNYQIIAEFLLDDHKEYDDKILELVNTYIQSEDNEDIKSINFDTILVSLLDNERYDRFKQLVENFKNNIKPLNGSFGNTGKDLGLQLVIKSGNLENVKEMVDIYNADVNLNNSLCLLYAIKQDFYRIAKFLINKGYDYENHKEVILKLIQRNEKKQLNIEEENKAKEYILKLLV